jgi:CheY-like chemotaxis protein
VLDLMMPEISGFDVLDTLRQDPVTAEIPIIILTAKILSEEDRQRLNGKVQRIIEKSRFDPAVLFGEVRRALAGAAKRHKVSSRARPE